MGNVIKFPCDKSTSRVTSQIVQTRRKLNRTDRQHELPSEDQSQDSAAWGGPFHFIQAADTQYGMIDSYIKKIAPIRWDEEIRLSELLIDKCNRMQPKPKFMVVCGDLTDAMPAEADSLRREQIYDFKRVFAKLDPSIPLVCVCGNHDVGNEPTMDSVVGYQKDFGDDYFYFVTGGILFIVINSQFYQHRANVEGYARQQDEWLVEVLKRCKQFKYSIVFEHIPWFLQKPDEEDEYFNITRATRMEWLKRFQEAGVTKIMCGHYHRNAGGWYENMELIVTSAVGAQCGNDKSGARVVRVLPGSVEHQYYALEDLPERVDLHSMYPTLAEGNDSV